MLNQKLINAQMMIDFIIRRAQVKVGLRLERSNSQR
jgi:hypothetical protein